MNTHDRDGGRRPEPSFPRRVRRRHDGFRHTGASAGFHDVMSNILERAMYHDAGRYFYGSTSPARMPADYHLVDRPYATMFDWPHAAMPTLPLSLISLSRFELLRSTDARVRR